MTDYIIGTLGIDEVQLGGNRLGLLRFVILDGGLEGFLGQRGTMNLHRGQAAQGVDDFLVGKILRFFQGAALDQFGGHAGGGDGAAAAEGLEAGVLDFAIANLERDFHDVAAGGRAHFADAVGLLNVTHVAGVQEVVHHRLVVKRIFFGLFHRYPLVSYLSASAPDVKGHDGYSSCCHSDRSRVKGFGSNEKPSRGEVEESVRKIVAMETDSSTLLGMTELQSSSYA